MGSSSPPDGRADAVRTPSTSPPGAPSRTAWESVPAKVGFCQVLSLPPNPASATGHDGRDVARWIGGSAGHAAARTGA
ncbi:hypothetical protein [Streptomyces althioticus]|uniref:hypothetical protein n=1 Tax=Streptomyces althioticus TaxID=83380 RepID=UPI0036F8FE43|nr:hypothetical protein OG872_15845 [Streptomyces althioticus]